MRKRLRPLPAGPRRLAHRAALARALLALAWLDVDRLTTVDRRVLTAVSKCSMMEISTGLFTENEDAPRHVARQGVRWRRPEPSTRPLGDSSGPQGRMLDCRRRRPLQKPPGRRGGDARPDDGMDGMLNLGRVGVKPFREWLPGFP